MLCPDMIPSTAVCRAFLSPQQTPWTTGLGLGRLCLDFGHSLDLSGLSGPLSGGPGPLSVPVDSPPPRPTLGHGTRPRCRLDGQGGVSGDCPFKETFTSMCRIQRKCKRKCLVAVDLLRASSRRVLTGGRGRRTFSYCKTLIKVRPMRATLVFL